ncbi:MAG: molybdopterin-dependent oxidoreductase, partial [Candidatus Accumulibacter sp.]|nr:molybdopterin-dependent oxidoreductase [Accumulibacter sp.]
PHDSIGANLTVQVKNNVVMRVLPRDNEDVNECWISDKERFSYEALNSPARLGKPMIRVDGALREVDWNVALDYVSHALKDVVGNSGAAALAALASPQATLEELYLLQKLTRALGSGSVDFRPRRRDFSADGKLGGIPWLGLKLSEIKDLDAALVVGSFLRKDHPLFAQRLRQLAKKWGKVSLLSSSGDDSLINLHAQLTVSPAELPLAMAMIVKAAAQLKGELVPAGLESVDPGATSQAIARSLLEGEKRAVFLGNAAEQHPQAAQLHALAVELARLTGATCGFIGEAANSVGGYVAKALPTALNAYEMFAQPRKAYILLGLEPELDCHDPQQAMAALKDAALVVMLTPFSDGAARDYADVLLPITPFTETSGSFVNTEGRIQSFTGVVRPLGDARPGWKVLRVLGNLLALPGFDQNSSEQVRDEMVPAGAAFVAGLDNGVSGVSLSLTETTGELQRIADVPIYFADPIARRAPSLQKTRDAVAPTARMNAATLARLVVTDGAPVRISQGSCEAVLIARADETVPAGCVRISAAHVTTAALGEMFGAINVERA